MTKRKKIILSLVIILACFIVGSGTYYFVFFRKHQSVIISENEILPLLTTDYLKETYEKAKKGDESIKNEPERVQNYFIAGIEWKTLGDLTNDERFYKKALEIYEKAIKITKGSNTVALVNAASMNILIKKYDVAEKYLQQAIVVSPGDIDLYLRLLELYKYYMKKDVGTVLAVYENAMKYVLNPFDVLRDRAAYLYELGRFDDALKDYKKLAEKFPNNETFKEKVAELELRIGK
jgi:tetratricopeptide (TPR) repeat protein